MSQVKGSLVVAKEKEKDVDSGILADGDVRW